LTCSLTIINGPGFSPHTSTPSHPRISTVITAFFHPRSIGLILAMSFTAEKDSKVSIQHNENIDDPASKVLRDEVTGEISEEAVRAESEEKVTFFVWVLVLASSISGLLFGM
jgi:hypothetical protein